MSVVYVPWIFADKDGPIIVEASAAGYSMVTRYGIGNKPFVIDNAELLDKNGPWTLISKGKHVYSKQTQEALIDSIILDKAEPTTSGS